MKQTEEQDLAGRFLREHRTELADKGFTERVMRRLPDRYERMAQVIHWVGGVAVVVLFVALGGVSLLADYGTDILQSLLTLDWHDSHLHTLASLLAGAAIVGVCQLSFREE